MSINEFLGNIDKITEAFLASIGIWGIVLSCLLIIVESILPVLPLCVFVTLVFLRFGNILGLIICWTCTCIGCFLSFKLSRSLLKNFFENKILTKREKSKVHKFMKYIDNMSVANLSLLVSIPFTPACVVNVAAGLSNMQTKKFMTAMLIGKIFMVYFWGYVGVTLIECFSHPEYIIKIIIMMLIAYVLSKVISSIFKLD